VNITDCSTFRVNRDAIAALRTAMQLVFAPTKVVVDVDILCSVLSSSANSFSSSGTTSATVKFTLSFSKNDADEQSIGNTFTQKVLIGNDFINHLMETSKAYGVAPLFISTKVVSVTNAPVVGGTSSQGASSSTSNSTVIAGAAVGAILFIALLVTLYWFYGHKKLFSSDRSRPSDLKVKGNKKDEIQDFFDVYSPNSRVTDRESKFIKIGQSPTMVFADSQVDRSKLLEMANTIARDTLRQGYVDAVINEPSREDDTMHEEVFEDAPDFQVVRDVDTGELIITVDTPTERESSMSAPRDSVIWRGLQGTIANLTQQVSKTALKSPSLMSPHSFRVASPDASPREAASMSRNISSGDVDAATTGRGSITSISLGELGRSSDTVRQNSMQRALSPARRSNSLKQSAAPIRDSLGTPSEGEIGTRSSETNRASGTAWMRSPDVAPARNFSKNAITSPAIKRAVSPTSSRPTSPNNKDK